jgi:hypothetical protein
MLSSGRPSRDSDRPTIGENPVNKTKLIALATIAMALVIVGCNSPTKATGGGQLVAHSVYPTEGGSFGFNGNSCEDTVTGQFNYIDQSIRIDGGVKIHGTVTDAYICEDFYFGCSPCALGEVVVAASYRSTNPLFPGTGLVTVCLTDGGEGNGTTDTGYISIDGGPFDGYALGGEISGNVQEHGCDDEDLLGGEELASETL